MPMGVWNRIYELHIHRGMRIKPCWDECYELKSLSQMDIIAWALRVFHSIFFSLKAFSHHGCQLIQRVGKYVCIGGMLWFTKKSEIWDKTECEKRKLLTPTTIFHSLVRPNLAISHSFWLHFISRLLLLLFSTFVNGTVGWRVF